MLLCVLIAFASGCAFAVLRAPAFGVSVRVLVAALLISSLLVATGLSGLAAFAPRWRLTKRVMLVLACVLGPLLLVEAWFFLDEAAFRREVQFSGTTDLSRPRWAPFDSRGLIYKAGEFHAHD